MAALVIRNFKQHHAEAKKGWGYRKLFRAEEGFFASLPWVTRGLAAMLLKHCDEDGTIDCGDLDPVVVVGRLIRATGYERRYLGEHIESLIGDGYLTWDGGPIGSKRVANVYQTRSKRVANRDQTRSKRVPNEYQTEHKRIVSVGDSSGPKTQGSNKGRKDLSASPTPGFQEFRDAFNSAYARCHGGVLPEWDAAENTIAKRALGHGTDVAVRRIKNLFDPNKLKHIPIGERDLKTLAAQWNKLADTKPVGPKELSLPEQMAVEAAKEANGE